MQNFKCGQGLAFQHFQECTAAGGDVAHLVFNAVLGNGRQRVAPTGNAERGGFGNRLGNHLGAVFKRGKLKHAHGAVPDDGAGFLELGSQFGGGLGADVQNQVVVLHLGGLLDRSDSVGRKSLGGDHIGGHGHVRTTGGHGVDHGLGIGHQIRLGQAFADLQTRSQHEGVGNATADDELVHLVGQRLEDGQLG